MHVARRPHGRSVLALLGRHAPAELERGVDGDRARRADAGERRERRDRLRRDAAAATRRRRREPRAPSPSADSASRTAAEEDREQLGRAQRVRAVRLEPLSRPLGARQLSMLVGASRAGSLDQACRGSLAAQSASRFSPVVTRDATSIDRIGSHRAPLHADARMRRCSLQVGLVKAPSRLIASRRVARYSVTRP